MGVLGKLGTLVALAGFALVGLGSYAILGGSGYGLALTLAIPGVFVIVAGMLIVSVANRNRGLNYIY